MMIPTNQAVYDHIKDRNHLTEVNLVSSLKGAFDWKCSARGIDLLDIIHSTREALKRLKR